MAPTQIDRRVNNQCDALTAAVALTLNKFKNKRQCRPLEQDYMYTARTFLHDLLMYNVSDSIQYGTRPLWTGITKLQIHN